MAEDIVGEAEPGSPSGGYAVLECGSGGVTAQASHAQLVYAFRINKWIRAGVSEVRFDVANMAIAIGPRTEEFRAQTEVEGQVVSSFPVVLGKKGGVVLAVFVVVNATSSEAELGRTADEVLKIGESVGSVGEE